MIDIRDFAGRGDWHHLNAPSGHDNNAALNSAIDHVLLNRTDYTIYFPAGKYRFAARPKSFPLAIKLVGNGPVGSSELGTLLRYGHPCEDPPPGR